MKDTIEVVRNILLAADSRIGECIKWQSPTFTYRGNLASFNPRSKQHASLMFHLGASIPGKHPRLEGGGDTARYMRFKDPADARSAAGDLKAIVAAWCDAKDGAVGSGTAKKARASAGARKQAAPKKTAKTARKKAAKSTKKKAAGKSKKKSARAKKPNKQASKQASKKTATKRASRKKTTRRA